MNLNENQTKAVEHLDSERLRYQRMATRLRTLRMYLLASVCDDFATRLKSALELQIRVLNKDESLLLTQREEIVRTTTTSPNTPTNTPHSK